MIKQWRICHLWMSFSRPFLGSIKTPQVSWQLTKQCFFSTSSLGKGTTHLFQTLALDSCRAGELAWKRARSDSTGELIKRGLGFRNDPMVWLRWGQARARTNVREKQSRYRQSLPQGTPKRWRKECAKRPQKAVVYMVQLRWLIYISMPVS